MGIDKEVVGGTAGAGRKQLLGFGGFTELMILANFTATTDGWIKM